MQQTITLKTKLTFRSTTATTATMSAATMSAASHKNATRDRRAPRRATAYCKVCHDAGRPPSEYTSHFVKDKKGPDGKVVCPLLLDQECRYCHVKGHTPKECPEILAKTQRRRQQRDSGREPDAQGFRQAKSRTRPGRADSRARVDEVLAPRMQRPNLFAALRDASDDEAPAKDAFPPLSADVAKPATVAPKLTGWAALAAKPALAPPKLPVQVKQAPTQPQDAWEDDESYYSDDSEDLRLRWQLDHERYKGMSWADIMDEEDEEDDW